MIGPITLPWPDKSLWPNGRSHWATKAKAVKGARRTSWALALAAMNGRLPLWKQVKLHWVIHPKTAHAIDDDAPPYALKSYRDGIADALGIDDKNFRATYEFGPPIKGGSVIVTIEEGENE